MKIMVVSNGWGVKTIGGGEYHILNVMSNWCKDDDVYLIIPRSGYELSKKIFSSNYTTYFSSNERIVDNLQINLFFYIIRIIRSIVVRRVKPDVVVSASHLFYDVLPSFLLSKRFKSKFVVYNHSIIKDTRKTNNGLYDVLSLINEKIGLYLSKNADLIFTVDIDTRDYLIINGFKKDKLVTTFNGIDNTLISSIGNNKIEYDGCFCGRITKTKGVLDIIEAWKQVVKVLPDAKIIVIGDGPDYNLMKDLIEKNNLQKRIILKGFVSETEKIKLIKSSKIFLFPSYEEAWGISVSEALSCEVAVICYDLKAYDIYGDGIRKIKVGMIKDLSQATLDLLRNDENRIELIQKGRKVIKKFKDWNKIANEQLEDIKKLFY